MSESTAVTTWLDELVDFPRVIVNAIANDELIRSLLADKPEATIDDIEDDQGNFKWLFDYDYVDDTVQGTGCYICIDAYVPRVENYQILSLYLVVSVIDHKKFMTLDSKKFPGIKGNRRDNIIRLVDKILNGSRSFGIGRLELRNIQNLEVPQRYTGKALVYEIYDFNRTGDDAKNRRVLLNQRPAI